MLVEILFVAPGTTYLLCYTHLSLNIQRISNKSKRQQLLVMDEKEIEGVYVLVCILRYYITIIYTNIILCADPFFTC